jgi:hypothetical protein
MHDQLLPDFLRNADTGLDTDRFRDLPSEPAQPDAPRSCRVHAKSRQHVPTWSACPAARLRHCLNCPSVGVSGLLPVGKSARPIC